MKTTAVVMVVDDEPRIREVIRHGLRADGYDVVEASDGEEALSLFEEHTPDLLLTDVRLRKMDGLRLVSKLRERDPNVPFIMLSTQGTGRTALKTRRLKRSDFIEKPFEIARLRSAVNRALKDRSPASTHLSKASQFIPGLYLG